MTVAELTKKVRLFGLQIFKRYYGFYLASVTDNNDPENLLRIKVVCPSLYGNRQFNQWIAPRGIFNSANAGLYLPPQIGSRVFITCLEGDANYPYWEHGNFGNEQQLPGQNNRLQQAGPDQYILKTPSGLLIHFNDSENTITIQREGGRNPTLKIIDDKLSFSNSSGDLKTQVDALIDAIGQLTVTTAFGPSGTPVNIAQFQSVQQNLNEILS